MSRRINCQQWPASVCQSRVYYSFQREYFLVRIQHDDGRLDGVVIRVCPYKVRPFPECDLAQYWHTMESSEEWLEIGGAVSVAFTEWLFQTDSGKLKWKKLSRYLARARRNLRREGWHSVADEFERAEKEMKEWGPPGEK